MTTSPGRGSEGIGVVILEPLGIVRASLRMVFEAESDIEVIGEASKAEEALEVATSLPVNSGVVGLPGLASARGGGRGGARGPAAWGARRDRRGYGQPRRGHACAHPA